MKHLIGVATFVFSLVVGFTFFVQTDDFDQKRGVASVKNNYDLTCTPDEELARAISERIVLGFKSFRKDGKLGFHIGHYVLSNSPAERKQTCATVTERSISSAFASSSKKTACQMYPQLRFKFVADGSSDSGEKRQMEVEAACEVSTDLSHTETVWVPWEQLAKETPFEGISQYNVPKKVSVKTSYISDKWPSKWVLDQIELVGEKDQVKVDSNQIRKIAGRPIVFEFN